MTRKRTIDYKLVEVCWIDAEENGDVGWNELKSQLAYAKKPCPTMRSVGYLVYEGKDHLSLLSTIGDKESSTLEKIPRAFIKSVTVMSPTPPVPAK